MPARTFRWLMSIAAAVLSLVLAMVAAPGGVATALPSDRRPTPTLWPGPTPSPKPPIVVLSVGDSLTVGGGLPLGSYRLELDRLMWMTAQPHTWVVAAVGGSKCSYWAGQLDALITQHQPHLILLNCGTNDTPSDPTEADYRTILATAQARGVPIVASLIGRPDPESPTNIVRWPEIDNWMDGTNTAIRAALADYPNVRVASVLRVPANIEWLQADGIHWTPRSEAAVGQLFYMAAQPVMGWLTLAQLGTHEMCGLSGHDRDEPWPTPDAAYIVCRS